jgi:hypothetical protein
VANGLPHGALYFKRSLYGMSGARYESARVASSTPSSPDLPAHRTPMPQPMVTSQPHASSHMVISDRCAATSAQPSGSDVAGTQQRSARRVRGGDALVHIKPKVQILEEDELSDIVLAKGAGWAQ